MNKTIAQRVSPTDSDSGRLLSVASCDRFHYALGLCRPTTTSGTSLLPCVSTCTGSGLPFRATHLHQRGEPARFLDLVLNAETNACIPWLFAFTGVGYGTIRHQGKAQTVHRLVCEYTHGPAPSPQHQAAHWCQHRECVNKDHIRWALPHENIADRKYIPRAILRLSPAELYSLLSSNSGKRHDHQQAGEDSNQCHAKPSRSRRATSSTPSRSTATQRTGR
jgi:hypothetical protein